MADKGSTVTGAVAIATALAASKAKAATFVTASIGSVNGPSSIGRNILDTSFMQGTTQEFVPDRVLLS